MNTRRQFLTRLLAVAGIPLIARALPQTQVQPPIMLPDGGPQPYKGPAIKVPSNRWYVYSERGPDGAFQCRNPVYEGDWDGTFKLEEDCTNPAYILADLWECTNGGCDWVVCRTQHALDGTGQVVSTRRLDWQKLYDWGRWCDEFVTTPEHNLMHYPGGSGPRSEVHTVIRDHADAEELREILRMRLLSWQSTDPRYRTSWPGVPYPKSTI